MTPTIDSTAGYPALPEGYSWVRGNQLNDYYVVEFVEVRKKTWWIFSESIDWYGVRSGENSNYRDLLKAHAEKIAPLIARDLP